MYKIRLTRVDVVEYVPNLEHYPDEINYIEEMAQFDIENAVEQGTVDKLFLNSISEEIKFEIVENENV